MKTLRTETIAKLLGQPCETIRTMARRGAVDWAVYIKPTKSRYGRGKYVYYPHKFAAAAGLTIDEVEAAMT